MWRFLFEGKNSEYYTILYFIILVAILKAPFCSYTVKKASPVFAQTFLLASSLGNQNDTWLAPIKGYVVFLINPALIKCNAKVQRDTKLAIKLENVRVLQTRPQNICLLCPSCLHTARPHASKMPEECIEICRER